MSVLCILCSLSHCIKGSARNFKIPRESLHIPMDKRAHNLLTQQEFLGDGFSKYIFRPFNAHNSRHIVLVKWLYVYNKATPILKRWHILIEKNRPRKYVGQCSLCQEKSGISLHIIIMIENILNSLNFFIPMINHFFLYHDESCMVFQMRDESQNGYINRLEEKYRLSIACNT